MTDKNPSMSLKETVKNRANDCCEYCYYQEKFATQIQWENISLQQNGRIFMRNDKALN